MQYTPEETASMAAEFLNTPYGKYVIATLATMLNDAHEAAEKSDDNTIRVNQVTRAKTLREVSNMLQKDVELYATGYFDDKAKEEQDLLKGNALM